MICGRYHTQFDVAYLDWKRSASFSDVVLIDWGSECVIRLSEMFTGMKCDSKIKKLGKGSVPNVVDSSGC